MAPRFVCCRHDEMEFRGKIVFCLQYPYTIKRAQIDSYPSIPSASGVARRSEADVTQPGRTTNGPHFPRALARMPTDFFLDSRPSLQLRSSHGHPSILWRVFPFSFLIHPLPLRAPKVCPWPPRASETTSPSQPPYPHPTCSCLSLTNIANTPHSAQALEPDFATTSTLPNARFWTTSCDFD